MIAMNSLWIRWNEYSVSNYIQRRMACYFHATEVDRKQTFQQIIMQGDFISQYNIKLHLKLCRNVFW